MKILFQPHDGCLEDNLNDTLKSNDKHLYGALFIMVAYVRLSGVTKLEEGFKHFIKTGGKIRAVVGIDQYNTSFEGLQKLLEYCDELYVFHNESMSQTYHPKVFLFVKRDDYAHLSVGSSNLTAGGLCTNYEFNWLTDINLRTKEGGDIVAKFIDHFERYKSNKGCSIRVTTKVIDELLLNSYIKREEEKNAEFEMAVASSKGASKMFGSDCDVKLVVKKAVKTKWIFKQPGATKSLSGLFGRDLDASGHEKILVWKKPNLEKSDAQRTDSGTNPTGCIRLVKSGYRVDGVLIDQTSYFREDIFGVLAWKQVNAEPFVAVAKARFHIILNGTDTGLHELEIRHKPSGEAGQGNQTTSISWGKMTTVIRDAQVIGKTFYLYVLSGGDGPLYLIDIH